MIVVDTCVLVDVLDDDAEWSDWSREQLDVWSSRGPLIINPVIYAELSIGFERVDAVDRIIERAGLDFREIPHAALFLAGKASQLYRRRGGRRTGVLSDFFIGAHAALLKVPVLTRDVVRYRGYFRNLDVIAPKA